MTTVDELDHVDRCVTAELGEEIPEIDLATEAIVSRIMGLNRRIKRMMEETLTEWGLSYGEWHLIGALRKAGPPYRRSPGQLAQRLELSSGAMTNRLDRLEQAGLVRRLPDPDDRRGVLVELTDAGRTAWEQSVSAQAEKESLVAAALSAKEKEQMNALLRRLMREFERREQKPS